MCDGNHTCVLFPMLPFLLSVVSLSEYLDDGLLVAQSYVDLLQMELVGS